ncbi:5-deoxy-glucuronate isomerase [Helcobacillus massiliensis]|uniref:5-deoxy-glucuronate isomerase n=1 Tax=Helcobacillus massiliensis TaxID=521392 RepID=A0A839R149_9MICO|nr:5-deoxy-glucuronate isomerase [Helcobacillus massiliensis]MBB3023567.1 5-deoxy-glucuronate isomerase [Helcobacillus massiliensis]MCT1557572.1 5-deoxy-glucuronate isomerase [Helcobacillus massiliensis]MCT2036797.1 5-deoxy-glucuronate isomerase [Helcobacillus massiliensis]MCT2332450.1 5-deoxy-glucuronate isomerase [Helcobacillus massiliensis]
MTDSSNLVIRRNDTRQGRFETVIDPRSRSDWHHTGLHVLELDAGAAEEFSADRLEVMVVPLNGSASVRIGEDTYDLRGRRDVFEGAADVLYAPVGSLLTITSDDGARLALATAPVDPDKSAGHPIAVIRKEDIPLEVRGAGSMTRQVRNFGAVGSFDAMDKLIVVEVVTPGGNWSSYPAHKHDEETETESELEEIYYFEIADSPEGRPGFGLHHTTSAREDEELTIGEQVYRGDTVLVPHGWHGPCAAAPGYDMFYLNVMAGPGERAWNITDHPDQAWVRGTWDDLEADPRLAG